LRDISYNKADEANLIARKGHHTGKSKMNNSDMPAMPTTYMDQVNGTGEMYCDNLGLTKREHFAAMAMQGFITAGFAGMPDDSKIVSMSVRYADEILAELAKGKS